MNLFKLENIYIVVLLQINLVHIPHFNSHPECHKPKIGYSQVFRMIYRLDRQFKQPFNTLA